MLKKWKNAGCVFCASNPTVYEDAYSEYLLTGNVKISGIGSGLVCGGICKKHFEEVGRKYMSVLAAREKQKRKGESQRAREGRRR